MTSQEFEIEIKKIDPRFSVVENQNRPGLANIFFEGKNYDLPVISAFDIREEVDRNYRYEFPNGLTARYWTRGEIVGRLEDFLKNFNGGGLTDLYAKE